MLEQYEINSSTLAIISIDDKTSQVYEEETEYVVNKSANKIIDYNCKYYGSSYRGRCEGTKYLTGVKSKCPIIIEESRNIIFFPTGSIRNNENSWLSLNNIKKYESNFYGTTIIFESGKKIDIPISYYSIDNQFCRSSILKSKLYDLKSIKK